MLTQAPLVSVAYMRSLLVVSAAETCLYPSESRAKDSHSSMVLSSIATGTPTVPPEFVAVTGVIAVLLERASVLEE